MTQLSRFDVQRHFMRKAMASLSPAEQQVMKTWLEEIIARTFDYKKGSKLISIVTVDKCADFEDSVMALAVLKKLVKCATEVEKEANKRWNGNDE